MILPSSLLALKREGVGVYLFHGGGIPRCSCAGDGIFLAIVFDRRAGLDSSAVLSLHCPLTAATKGLLDRAAMEKLPAGAVLINTARGGIMDEAAAMDLLRAGHLGGVGLDVYEDEPALLPGWLQAPRTVLLPHLGSATVETREAMARMVCEGVTAVLSSRC